MTDRTAGDIEHVRDSLQQSPKRSVALHSRTLRLSKRKCKNNPALRFSLLFHPYKLQFAQAMTVAENRFIAHNAAFEVTIYQLLSSLGQSAVYVDESANRST